LRRQIVRAVIKAGNPRPIALLCGLSEKIIMHWKDIFAQELPPPDPEESKGDETEPAKKPSEIDQG